MTASSDPRPVLAVEHLSIDYLGDRTVHAVSDVTFSLGRNEILGLAGESGCGKSTLAYGVIRLLKPPGLITAGTAEFHDADGSAIDLRALSGEQLRAFRWDKISMVFQGAMNSLNPVLTVRAQLEDVFTTHRPGMSKRERRERCGELLERVSVDRRRLHSYPHELSGGQRQRVAIARALAPAPSVLIADEPVSMLDVSIRLGILNLLADLQLQDNLAVLYITHDLATARHFSDEILVMLRGAVVQRGSPDDVILRPSHEYTKLLAEAAPNPEKRIQR